MTLVRFYISIITLNKNRLNSPVKRHKVVGWINKQDPTIYCLKRHTSTLITHIGSKWRD